MMIPAWGYLEPQDKDAFRAAIEFLRKRLQEEKTVTWALTEGRKQRIAKLALEELLSGPVAVGLEEPWASTWRLVEESWSASEFREDDGTTIHAVNRRLRGGDNSGAVVAALVSLVAPRLKVEPIEKWRWTFTKKPRRPKFFGDLIAVSLTSGDLISPDKLDLDKVDDLHLLKSLARSLEAVILQGLDIASRIGWDGQGGLWRLGDLRRVYYVSHASQDGENRDPDLFHRGIAPSVKLLYAVVSRMADLDLNGARLFVRSWRWVDTPVHLRLWAAMARNAKLVTPDDVSSFILELNSRQFWDLHIYPEVAELRAARFNDLSEKTQEDIANRIRKGPPRNHWPKESDPSKLKEALLYWSIREFKRIECAGGHLTGRLKSWVDAQGKQFDDLDVVTIDEGFLETVSVRSAPRSPDDKFNTIEGTSRLRALETALQTRRGGWDDDPAERANDWLREPGKAALILSDLEASGDGGDEFPTVWNRFGWAHSPESKSSAPANPEDEVERVLKLLNQLSKGTLLAAIEGISAWLSAWEKQLVTTRLMLPVWSRIWPIAVDATNKAPKSKETDLRIRAPSVDDDREPMDIETLNSPAGKLVGVFLAACPRLRRGKHAFTKGSVERSMRDIVVAAAGTSGLIVRKRLIEALPYFLNADPEWTKKHLVAPLRQDDGASLALWQAIAHRTHFTKVLKIIGSEMADRATDLRLARETRQRLAFSIVVETLHAFREDREPAIPFPRVTQMLRTLDDEIRASAANAIQQFVNELSKSGASQGQAGGEEDNRREHAGDIFRCAVAPFLLRVWPQERSLATPGVSNALADLPATSGEAFAEAVEVISRFLVPFDCWSLLDFGLYGDKNGNKKLALIDDGDKARALLNLLDLTVGSVEGAVIPYDLTDALDQIKAVAPSLSEERAFQRLSTSARR
ncbi:hypothetical protein [Tianweitania sp.]|uniref:hypothetical protein n=1 Tax=Tianweitania sp. TaxID=2021634 RepID=UPI0028A09C1E|nr:hypothetical protein [Tianweitania sp.]